MDLRSEIKGIIARELAVEEGAIVPEAHLQDDLGADSLGILNLAEAIAKKYGIELAGDDLVDIANTDELIELVELKISEHS